MNNLNYVKKQKRGGIIFSSRFVNHQGEINIKQVGVWYRRQGKNYWIIFEKSNDDLCEIARGIDNKFYKNFWIGSDDVYNNMRLVARNHFHSAEWVYKKVWKKVYSDLAPDKKRKKLSKKGKRQDGLTNTPPPPDLFADLETPKDLKKILSHRGSRKKDSRVHSIRRRSRCKSKKSIDYENLENQGQQSFISDSDEPLGF